jgi:hypothetical protein
MQAYRFLDCFEAEAAHGGEWPELAVIRRFAAR